MFPVQNGLYGHRSTVNQFAKPGYPFLNFDPYPFTNSNLNELHIGNTSSQSGDELFDHDIIKENDHLSAKKQLSKAERRAEHNAIERARRETLNHKFKSLAQALPNLSSYRRPSKSQIIEKAFDWVKQGIAREERYRYQIIQLQGENKRLLAQLTGIMTTPSNSSLTYDLPEHAGWPCDLIATPQMTPSSSAEDLSISKLGELAHPSNFPRIDEEDDSGSVHEEDDQEYRHSALVYNQFEQNFSQSSFMSTDVVYPIGFKSNNAHLQTTAMPIWDYPSDEVTNDQSISTHLDKKPKSIHS